MRDFFRNCHIGGLLIASFFFVTITVMLIERWVDGQFWVDGGVFAHIYEVIAFFIVNLSLAVGTYEYIASEGRKNLGCTASFTMLVCYPLLMVISVFFVIIIGIMISCVFEIFKDLIIAIFY